MCSTVVSFCLDLSLTFCPPLYTKDVCGRKQQTCSCVYLYVLFFLIWRIRFVCILFTHSIYLLIRMKYLAAYIRDSYRIFRRKHILNFDLPLAVLYLFCQSTDQGGREQVVLITGRINKGYNTIIMQNVFAILKLFWGPGVLQSWGSCTIYAPVIPSPFLFIFCVFVPLFLETLWLSFL